MPRPTLIALLLTTAAAGAGAQLSAPGSAPVSKPISNCEPLREKIAAKLKAGGLPQAQLVVVDAGAATTGRVVGTCERGTRKIVQASSGPTAPATRPAPRNEAPILTECKDGRVSMGGNCRK